MEFFREIKVLTENTIKYDVTCSVILGTVCTPQTKINKKNINSSAAGLKISFGSYNDVEFGVDVQELAFFINDRQGRNTLLHKLI